jgi:cysteinyl-tRNA synthetase
MEEYFQYDINYVINVTDVDDKIIKKANLVLLQKINKFLKENEEKFKDNKDLITIFEKSEIRVYEDSKFPDKALENKDICEFISELRKVGENVLSKELLSEEADFVGVARYWEKRYWEDMKNLHVRMPDSITRVTEYIEKIIDFVKVIVDNGYAYVSNESVYFDTKKFNESKNHTYGKLEPNSVGDEKLLQGKYFYNMKRVKVNGRNKKKDQTKSRQMILQFGKSQVLVNQHGIHHGEKEDRDGTLNVQQWQVIFWEKTLMFIVGVLILEYFNN